MTWNGFSRKNSRLICVATLVALANLTGCSDDSNPGDGHTATDAVATPEFDVAGGTFPSAQNVAIRTATAGATIHYTLDGSTPNSTSPIYDSPIAIAKTTTLKAMARRAGAADSQIQSANYVIEIPSGTALPVQFEPNSGHYSNDVSVSLSSGTAGAAVCYTLDASAPACDIGGRCAAGSLAYAAGTTVQISETGKQIRAVACKGGMLASSETHADYTLQAAPPEFHPLSETYDSSRPIEVTTATAGAVIRYAVDGAIPNCTDSTAVPDSGWIHARAATHAISAIACKDKYAASEVATVRDAAACKGDFTASTPSQLDALSGCREITGNLTIEGRGISSLARLGSLERVGGSLTVSYASKLESLAGLQKLASVGGDLSIQGNYRLGSLDALESLYAVGGVLRVESNAVTSWAGPNNLMRVGALQITEPSLTSLTGFSALTSIRGNAIFRGNPVLQSVTGFSKVRDLSGIDIAYNASLSRFAAFSNVKAVHGDVYISDSPKLAQLDLKGIEVVDGGVTIGVADGDGLPALTSMDGFTGLTTIGKLDLRGNVGFADLKGLGRLTRIKDGLSVDRTPAKFASLAGLDSLTSVGRIELYGSEGLRNLRGLEKVETLNGGSISIYKCHAMTEIGGLNAIRSVNYLLVGRNEKLTHLDGFHRLESAYDIRFIDNVAMTKLDGLEALTHAGRELVFEGNSLASLAGLEALTTIDGKLRFDGERVLEDITGFDALTKLGSLLIVNNPALSTCRAERFAAKLEAQGRQGTTVIYENHGTGTCN